MYGELLFTEDEKNTEKYQVCKRSLKAEHSRSK